MDRILSMGKGAGEKLLLPTNLLASPNFQPLAFYNFILGGPELIFKIFLREGMPPDPQLGCFTVILVASWSPPN